MITKSLEGAQKKVEGFNFDQRKNVVQYDDVMNRHRRAIYSMRREVLRAEDISARIKKMIGRSRVAGQPSGIDQRNVRGNPDRKLPV
jgi:preprotein translocase subunit SecA